jgi:SAM-dependent methyltransferase
MSSAKSFSRQLHGDAQIPKRADIVWLSDRQTVSMEERYFDLVDLQHFWAVRRFEVMQKLAGPCLDPQLSYCEVGCGNGILQRQLELHAKLKVDGFELCPAALEQSQARSGTLYYYDVFEQRTALKEKYDGLFLFDVLEHLEDDHAFLRACLFHLKIGGRLIVNVPARQELFSKYDRVAGHARRYTLQRLKSLADATGLQTEVCTYWGLPLYPVLMLRKILVSFSKESSVYEKGFTPPNALSHSMLRFISRLEFVPQRFLGTSILAVFVRKS